MPLSESFFGKRKLIIEDTHVNMFNVLSSLNKFIEKEYYLILEDSLTKHIYICEFLKDKLDKYKVYQYYIDLFLR